MAKNLPEIAVLMAVILLVYEISPQASFYLLVIILLSVLIFRIDEIMGLFSGKTKILEEDKEKLWDSAETDLSKGKTNLA